MVITWECYPHLNINSIGVVFWKFFHFVIPRVVIEASILTLRKGNTPTMAATAAETHMEMFGQRQSVELITHKNININVSLKMIILF